MIENDADENRTQVDPAEFETFDHYDPNLDPPETPDDADEDEADGDADADPALSFGRSVPAWSVEGVVGVLSAAYNKR